MTAITLVLLAVVLTVREFAYGQQWYDVYIKEAREEMADFKQKQNETLEILKGYGDLQQKQNDILAKLSGYGDLQQKQNDILAKLSGMQEKQEHVESKLQEMQENQGHIKGKLQEIQEKQEHAEGKLQEIQEKQEHVEGKLQEMQEKLQHVEINLQEFHHELEHVKGAVNSNQDSLQNISAKLETLEDIDECTEGKAECSPQATCRNFIGSYSCSCNPPFEGNGRTCEFSCRSPDKVFEGLGCVKLLRELKTFEETKATCHQAGGRLLQDFTYERLQEVGRAFGYRGWRWIGVREGKWLESGLPLQEELWHEDSRGSDPSGRRGLCGVIYLDSSSSSYKVGQRDCSSKILGYCQFLIPQK